jgi:cytochrome c biogenesis protein CcmG/thiol:disulfide interchange protein DsbE
VATLAVISGYLGLNLAAGEPSQSVIVVPRNPLLDQPAPGFTLQALDGSTVSLGDYRGRPVIVNFWASWCQPCQQEFPLFAAARAQHAVDGLEILGIVHNDTTQAAQAFAAHQGAAWPLLSDPDDTAWQAYRGALLPISYYIDRDGIIRAVSYGPPSSGTLDDLLAKIL